MTLTLLAAGGAMFMTALDVSRGWQLNIDKIYQTRKYDLELRLNQPTRTLLEEVLAQGPDVQVKTSPPEAHRLR